MKPIGAVDPFRFDDSKAQSGTECSLSGRGSSTARFAGSLRSLVPAVRCQRTCMPRSTQRRRSEVPFAASRAYDGIANSETKPSSVALLCGPVKSVEEMRPGVGGDAGSVVFDGETDPIARRLNRDSNGSVALGVATSIVNQHPYKTVDPFRRRTDPRDNVFFPAYREPDTPAGRHCLKALRAGNGDLCRVNRLAAWWRRRRIKPREP